MTELMHHNTFTIRPAMRRGNTVKTATQIKIDKETQIAAEGIDTQISTLHLLLLGLCIADSEIRWQNRNDLTPWTILTSLTILRIAQTVVAVLSALEVLRYRTRRRSLLRRNRSTKRSTILSVVFEIVISLIHIPPGINRRAQTFSDSAYVDVLVFAAFAKLYILGRLMKNSSPLNTHSARFIGSFTKVEYGDWFLVKVWLKANPLLSLVLSWLVITFVSSYLLYIVEREYPVVCGDSSAYFESYFNSVWCIIVTVLTVGYGDVTPHTVTGRTITVITTFFGLVCTATLIGIVSDYLSLNNEEFVVIKFIDEHKKIKTYESAALKCVKAAVRTFVKKKKKVEIEEAVEQMEEEVAQFRYYRRKKYGYISFTSNTLTSIEGRLVKEQQKLMELAQVLNAHHRGLSSVPKMATLKEAETQTEIVPPIAWEEKNKLEELTQRVNTLYKKLDEYKRKQKESQTKMEQRIIELEGIIKEILSNAPQDLPTFNLVNNIKS